MKSNKHGSPFDKSHSLADEHYIFSMYFGTVPSVIQYVKRIDGNWGGIRGEEASAELHIVEVETMHEQHLSDSRDCKTSGYLALKHPKSQSFWCLTSRSG